MKKWMLLILIIIGVAISNITPTLSNSQTWKWNADPVSADIKGHIVDTEVSHLPNPTPMTMILFGFGLIGLAGLGRKMNKN